MIFIIGASGLIGGNILNYLKKKGYKVSGTYFKTKKKDFTILIQQNMILKN